MKFGEVMNFVRPERNVSDRAGIYNNVGLTPGPSLSITLKCHFSWGKGRKKKIRVQSKQSDFCL